MRRASIAGRSFAGVGCRRFGRASGRPCAVMPIVAVAVAAVPVVLVLLGNSVTVRWGRQVSQTVAGDDRRGYLSRASHRRVRVDLPLRVVAGPHQRPALDVTQALVLADAFPLVELRRRHPAVDRQVLGRRLQVLAQREDVDVVGSPGRPSHARSRAAASPMPSIMPVFGGQALLLAAVAATRDERAYLACGRTFL